MRRVAIPKTYNWHLDQVVLKHKPALSSVFTVNQPSDETDEDPEYVDEGEKVREEGLYSTWPMWPRDTTLLARVPTGFCESA